MVGLVSALSAPLATAGFNDCVETTIHHEEGELPQVECSNGYGDPYQCPGGTYEIDLTHCDGDPSSLRCANTGTCYGTKYTLGCGAVIGTCREVPKETVYDDSCARMVGGCPGE